MGPLQPPCSQPTSRKLPSLRPRPAGAPWGITGWPGEIAPLSNSHHIQDLGGVTLRAPPFVALTPPYPKGIEASSPPYRQLSRSLKHPQAIPSRSYSHATPPLHGSYLQPTTTFVILRASLWIPFGFRKDYLRIPLQVLRDSSWIHLGFLRGS